jgi:hypothetical protein
LDREKLYLEVWQSPMVHLAARLGITRMVGSVFGRQDASAMMGQLAPTVSGNPETLQGLRKAVVKHMPGRLVSNTETATSGRALLKSDQ